MLVAALVLATVLAAGQKPAADYPITFVPLTDVTITDEFWKPRIERNRTVTIPHILRQNEITGRVDNFLKAANKKPGEYKGQRYNDTDIYKVLEAASYVLATNKDAELDRKVDELIAIVGAAQEPDGYLYTPRSVDPKNPAPGAGPERWSYLHTSHELYDMGHMIEAAVAHHQATGKRNFLEIGLKAANLIVDVFGPEKRRDVPGHQEIEIALVKLHRLTGEEKYLRTAKFFLEQRGRTHSVEHATFEKGNRFFMYNDGSYRQDHVPVVEQTRATGHAVRATYMFAAMTDVAVMAGEPAFAKTLDTVFDDITSRRFYLTGGLGSQGATEAFGEDYVLPNRRAYAETCASIGGILWYQRMFQRTGDAKYIDVLERTLYNGYLSGVSASGDRFFYQNPLESDGKSERVEYFDVACCPANLARLMAQLPGLVYAQRAASSESGRAEVFVNQFIGSEAKLTVRGTPATLIQRTNYPWNGRVTIRVAAAKPVAAAIAVRIPGWARGDAMPSDLYRFAAPAGSRPAVAINGQPFDIAPMNGYVYLARTWGRDTITVDLPMPVQRVLAHQGVEANRGKAAIQRGPLVYAVEAVDNGGKVTGLKLPLEAKLSTSHDKNLLGGLTIIRGGGVTAIPYFAWNNRGKGEMAVWMPTDGKPQAASVNTAVAVDQSPRLASTRGRLAPAEELDKQSGEAASAARPRDSAGAAVEQTSHGTGPPAALVASFDGLGEGFEGPHGPSSGRNPSDNSLAVGPDHIVQTVNSRLAIFTKKGAKYDTTGRVLYGAVPTNTLFAGFGGTCEARNNGDAVVRYDQLADRWLVVMPIFRRSAVRPDQPPVWKPGATAYVSPPGVAGQPGQAAKLFVPPPAPPPDPAPAGRGAPPGRRGQAPQAKGPYSMCYAISASPDPLGTYYRYEFLRPLFPDYPRPAVWPDGYYVPTSTGDEVIEKHACVVDRERMLAGEPATEQCIVIEGVNFLNNADVDGKALPPAGAPNIMMATGGTQLKNDLDDDGIYVWQFKVDWKDPGKTTVSAPKKMQVAPYQYLCGGQLTNCVPQPGSDRRLDAQGDKIMARLVYRRLNGHESVVAVHSVNTAAGGGGVRWYEFRVAKDRSVALHQQGTYAPEGFYRWMASPAIDKLGNIGIGYSFGGTPHFAGQRFAGRLASDPPGVLSLREAVLVEGEGAQTNTMRWEDYSQTAVDPSDDCTIWYVGDYFRKGATNYSTRIGAFRMPGCSGG